MNCSPKSSTNFMPDWLQVNCVLTFIYYLPKSLASDKLWPKNNGTASFLFTYCFQNLKSELNLYYVMLILWLALSVQHKDCWLLIMLLNSDTDVPTEPPPVCYLHSDSSHTAIFTFLNSSYYIFLQQSILWISVGLSYLWISMIISMAYILLFK